MNDTAALLKECNAGCKTAVNRMEQLQQYVKDPGLNQLLDRYRDRHTQLGEACHTLLSDIGMSEKDPQPIPAAMAKMGVAMKMAISPDTPHIADLLEDGCTMGIKSLARYRNQYAEASGQAKRITGELIDLECEMARELLAFL